ncbi:TrkH family potassium uptake protein [Melioribacter sp. OK-6-Me]|uniref:TrkH family potassium uptake protein n=1 Tax=unclassified Melioribacter TaxID=2627329 RepID=UPI003ED934FE
MKKELRENIARFSKIIVIISSLLGIASIIVEYGFQIKSSEAGTLHFITIGVIIVFIIYHILQLYISENKALHLKTHKFEIIIISLILLEGLLSFFNLSLVERIGTALKLKNITYLYIVFAQIFIVVGIISGTLRYNIKLLQSKIHPSRLFIFSFLFTIIVGTFALMLPASTVEGKITFVDALFTSTSAVCVTGLVTLDTATYFTTFGKLTIMALFQIGGLGLMTFTTFFAIFLSGGLGIKERILLHDLLEEENIGAITRVLTYLLSITFIIEAIGTSVLFYSCRNSFSSINDALFISIFHSISAFCNAGFSLFSMNLMDPAVRYNHLFTTTITILIILGGLGFPTIISLLRLKNITSKMGKLSIKLPLQTRIVIFSTVLLIIFGAVSFYFLEQHNTLRNLNLFEKINASYFQSVTARTAGFNTIDFGLITTPTAVLFLLLMFIGASPGGTGGGVKTTTFALLFYGSIAILKNKKEVSIYNRAIPNEVIIKALIKAGLSIFFITFGIFLLTITERADLTKVAFEAFSAFGTVGLSMGLTPELTWGGKIIIVLLMFIGRVGPLAFLYTFMTGTKEDYYELPHENISIL